MMKLKTIILSLMLLMAMSMQAENYPYRSDYLWLTVPDHANWLYQTGEQAKVEPWPSSRQLLTSE